MPRLLTRPLTTQRLPYLVVDGFLYPRPYDFQPFCMRIRRVPCCVFLPRRRRPRLVAFLMQRNFRFIPHPCPFRPARSTRVTVTRRPLCLTVNTSCAVRWRPRFAQLALLTRCSTTQFNSTRQTVSSMISALHDLHGYSLSFQAQQHRDRGYIRKQHVLTYVKQHLWAHKAPWNQSALHT